MAGRATFSGSGIGFYVRLTSAGAIDRSITTSNTQVITVFV